MRLTQDNSPRCVERMSRSPSYVREIDLPSVKVTPYVTPSDGPVVSRQAPRATQWQEGAGDQMNPTITTGTTSYMGESRPETIITGIAAYMGAGNDTIAIDTTD